MRIILPAAAIALWVLVSSAPAGAEVKTQAVDYEQGGVALQGYLAYDDAVQGKRPGVVIFPEWWGLTDYPKHRAEQLAKLGYVAFAADVYGKGVTTHDPKEAGKLAGPFREDRGLARARAGAALDVLRKQPQTDGAKVAAIGYCFGGTLALELARAGADLTAVVGFHAGLDTPHPDQDQPIKAKVLVCAGADDAFVPPQQIAAFEDEMRKAGADYEVAVYGGAVHAFTNPDAGYARIKNVAYNEAADRRSWAAMRQLFDEAFGPVEHAQGKTETGGNASPAAEKAAPAGDK